MSGTSLVEVLDSRYRWPNTGEAVIHSGIRIVTQISAATLAFENGARNAKSSESQLVTPASLTNINMWLLAD